MVTHKGDTEAQSSRREIQEGSIISQGAATAPRYKRKDQSSAGTLWKGFPFLCRGDSLPPDSSGEVQAGDHQ